MLSFYSKPPQGRRKVEGPKGPSSIIECLEKNISSFLVSGVSSPVASVTDR